MSKKEIPVNPWREDLTERDIKILDEITDEPQTTRKILERLNLPDSFEIREAIIGRLTRLEGMGLIRRLHPKGEIPTTWTVTFRGKRQ